MVKTKQGIRVSCHMDCPDLCRFVVTVENKRIVSLKGDPNHPVTCGVVCKKGRALVDRHYHSDRIRYPLIRKGDSFVKTTYDHVLNSLAEEFTAIRRQHGSTAILNYTSDGYGGLKGRIQSIFFNCFGGVTVPRGSLCWGAGIAAQAYDFGNPRGHDPDDVQNAKMILIWGRNPKETSLHFYAKVKKAQKNGCRVIVIDPIKTATAKAFDEHVPIVPSTDGALALGMAHVIIKKGLVDTGFVEDNVKGFNRFTKRVKSFTPQKVQTITGVPADAIERLAIAYANTQRACIYIGFGMQRYQNGGNAVRAIDALGAITGKIGQKGCGINYAAKAAAPFAYNVEKQSRKQIRQTRSFPVARLGEYLDEAKDPAIKAIIVAGGNPLTQSPDLKRTAAAFSRIKLKVVFDHFMTDTARHADIVLPAATSFEQDDIFITSMYSPIINYSSKAVEPPCDVMPEFEFYLKLAHLMGMDNLGFSSSDTYLETSIQPLLANLGISYQDLKKQDQYIRLKSSLIPWEKGQFETASGKYELYSETAQKDGLSPLPEFIAPMTADRQFPLRLLTCHTRDSLHSQGFAFVDDLPTVYINGQTAAQCGLVHGQKARVVGKNAAIETILVVSEDIIDNTAFMHQGWWHKSGAVNFLTDPVISDMGEQAAYYDSFCRIENSV